MLNPKMYTPPFKKGDLIIYRKAEARGMALYGHRFIVLKVLMWYDHACTIRAYDVETQKTIPALRIYLDRIEEVA